jgi:hypothetical protein
MPFLQRKSSYAGSNVSVVFTFTSYLRKRAFPESEGFMQQTETFKCLSIRQPWAWLITHPEIVRACHLPIKDIENREWTTPYRGYLLIHTGATLDTDLFGPTGQLEGWYWRRTFGSAGEALFAAMPKQARDYPRRAIVGETRLTAVVRSSTNPWFCGPYGLVLHKAAALLPIEYRGQLKIFDVLLPEGAIRRVEGQP